MDQNAGGSGLKLTVMRGVPGSGKSTYAKSLGGYVVSADNFFIGEDGVYRFDATKLSEAHGQCYDSFLLAMSLKHPHIIVDNTNIEREHIEPYVSIGLVKGYNVEIVEVRCDPEVAGRRNVHGVPWVVSVRKAERMNQVKLPTDWNVRAI